MGLENLERLEEKLYALGMDGIRMADGRLEARASFRSLVNAFTRKPIPHASVRNFGEDSVVCSSPTHLTHLPAIKVLSLRNAAEFEYEMHALYQRRLEKLHEANKFLSTLKLPAVLDEPGFRVVSEIWVGNDVVRFTLRAGAMVQVLAVAGTSLDGRVDPRARRVDASKVRTPATLALALEPLLVRLRAALAGAGQISASGGNRAPFSSPAAAGNALISVEAEDSREFAAAAKRPDAPPAPQAVAKRAQNDLFDHGFSGVLAEEPSNEDTFGGFDDALRASADRNRPPEAGSFAPAADTPQTVSSSDDAPLIALVCKACGSFYLVEEKPADARLLDTCPRCLGITPAS